MPEFDPNKPFQTTSKQPEFDESQPFDKVQEPTTGDHVKGMLEGFANVPFGLNKMMGGADLPEAQAMLATKMPDPNEDVNRDLKARGFKINEPQWNSYDRALAANRKYRDDITDKDPLAVYAGEGLAGLIPVGGAAVKGAGLLKALANHGLVKAVTGGALGSYLYNKFTKD